MIARNSTENFFSVCIKKRKKIFFAFLLFFILFFSCGVSYVFRQPDITIIGPIKVADGLGRNTVDFINVLSENYYVNCIPTDISTKNLSFKTKLILRNPNKRLGKVILYTKPVWNPKDKSIPLKKIRNANSLRIAYSMFESSLLPNEWVTSLNVNFDIVAVPDEYLVSVYKNSGVSLPIKVLPLCVDFSKLKQINPQQKKDDFFTFTILSSGIYRKNILQVVRVFNKLFHNSEKVILKINSRYSLDGSTDQVKQFIKKNKICNIVLSEQLLKPSEYNSMLATSNCLINASLGEGFSIQPREAMMLGIPCIVTNNTAQRTICDSGLVATVPCTLKEPAYHYFKNIPYGEYFRCTDEDLAFQILDVYKNYGKYLNKKDAMKAWADQYDITNLKQQYIDFFNLENLKNMSCNIKP